MDDLLDFFGSKVFQTWWWVVIPAAVLIYIIWSWVKGTSKKRRRPGTETDYDTSVVDGGRTIGGLREKDRWNRDHSNDEASGGGSHSSGGAD
jgi:hypothetical protein